MLPKKQTAKKKKPQSLDFSSICCTGKKQAPLLPYPVSQEFNLLGELLDLTRKKWQSKHQGSERLRDASGNMTSTPHGFYPNGSLKSLENKKYTYLEPTTRNSKSVGLGEAPDICVFTKLP